MTEQTPNEPRDLDSEWQQAADRIHRHTFGEPIESLHLDLEQLTDAIRNRDRAIEGLRARPTLDRERLADVLMQVYDHGTQPNAYREADAILTALAPQGGYVNRGIRELTADVLALLAAVGQGTPEPEWADPEPWIEPATGARFATELADYSGYSRNLKKRTRAQYDAEQGT